MILKCLYAVVAVVLTPSQALASETQHTYRDGDKTVKITLQEDLVGVKGEYGQISVVPRSEAPATADEEIPVFADQEGTLLALQGDVVLMFDKSLSEEQLASFLDANGLLDRVGRMGYSTHAFRIKTDPGWESLELANRLAEKQGVAVSRPDWWRKRRAR